MCICVRVYSHSRVPVCLLLFTAIHQVGASAAHFVIIIVVVFIIFVIIIIIVVSAAVIPILSLFFVTIFLLRFLAVRRHRRPPFPLTLGGAQDNGASALFPDLGCGGEGGGGFLCGLTRKWWWDMIYGKLRWIRIKSLKKVSQVHCGRCRLERLQAVPAESLV